MIILYVFRCVYLCRCVFVAVQKIRFFESGSRQCPRKLSGGENLRQSNKTAIRRLAEKERTARYAIFAIHVAKKETHTL
jgi:hypothetical protein